MVTAKTIELNKGNITELPKKTLLSTDDAQMWLEHLDEVRKNRVEGAKKAAAAKRYFKFFKAHTVMECQNCIPNLEIQFVIVQLLSAGRTKLQI